VKSGILALTKFLSYLLIGMGNNPMVGATVSVAVAIAEAAKAGKF